MKAFPILGIMFLIMFTLKIAEVGAVATWSWWFVTAPLWAPFAIVFAILGFGLLAAIIAAGGKWR